MFSCFGNKKSSLWRPILIKCTTAGIIIITLVGCSPLVNGRVADNNWSSVHISYPVGFYIWREKGHQRPSARLEDEEWWKEMRDNIFFFSVYACRWKFLMVLLLVRLSFTPTPRPLLFFHLSPDNTFTTFVSRDVYHHFPFRNKLFFKTSIHLFNKVLSCLTKNSLWRDSGETFSFTRHLVLLGSGVSDLYIAPFRVLLCLGAMHPLVSYLSYTTRPPIEFSTAKLDTHTHSQNQRRIPRAFSLPHPSD